MLFQKKNPTKQNQDWVTDATDLIERAIDTLRDKAVVPLITVARGIVYGLIVAIVGVAALVLALITFIRLLDVYLDAIPGIPEGVWVVYLLVGAIFLAAGMLLLRSARRATKPVAK